jgi:hypothetical protein
LHAEADGSITTYESQVELLFDGPREMADAVRAYNKSLGIAGDVDAPAELLAVKRV